MTAQYYLWYYAILPVAAMNNTLTLGKHSVLIAAWAGGQFFWGYFANAFENGGEDTIRGIQYANYLWFLINIAFMLIWARHQELTLTREYGQKAAAATKVKGE